MIGVCRHTLVEVSLRKRRYYPDDFFKPETQCRAAGKRRNSGADSALSEHSLHDRQLTVRRSFLHGTTLT